MSEQRTRHVTISRAHLHAPTNVSAKASDAVASFVGSWSFVVLMTFLLTAWITWNSLPGLPHFDAPPFILLNLCLSFLAGYTAPFIMMSQNRQGEKDALRDNLEAKEVAEIYSNHQELLEISRRVLDLQQQQMDILKEQTVLKQQNEEILSRLPARRKAEGRG